MTIPVTAVPDETPRCSTVASPVGAGGRRPDWRSEMEKVAVAVMPIADLRAWQAFIEEIRDLPESREAPSALPVISDRGVPGLGWA